MADRSRPLARISTQYARNGPLLSESREYVRLVARGLQKEERRRVLVLENGLGRQTYKARRNIFEALEARFADQRRAADLGLLSLSSAPSKAFSVGALIELARHDLLIQKFVSFLVRHIGLPIGMIDARRFLDELDTEDGSAGRWSPSLRRRAESSLNAIPSHFELWSETIDGSVPAVHIPIELAALIVQERLEAGSGPINAVEFDMLGLRAAEVIELLWACARRNWFSVDVVGNVVRVEQKFKDLSSLLDAGAGAWA